MAIQYLKKPRVLRMVLVLIPFALLTSGFLLRFNLLQSKGPTGGRPSVSDAYVYDYGHLLRDVSESANAHLAGIKKQYAIEGVIVTVAELPSGFTIETLAVELFSKWNVGGQTGGRGFLLLFSGKEKRIKLEISYELEDVFTDIFCGHIEDKQLKPYFLSNQLAVGLIAVLEEIEQRAQMKHQAGYNTSDIEILDRKLLSGGAGAARQLTAYQPAQITPTKNQYPPGDTPASAWSSLLQAWKDKARSPDLGVYTAITRLAYRDFQNMPDSRYDEDYRTYHNKSFEVLQQDNYAVIYFGKKKGWENAPFLFCRTETGWQMDIVHQRKYVRMGSSPHWGIERADYPYVDLLAKCPYWMKQDIPWDESDRYRVKDDGRLAAKIKQLEKAYGENPQDFQTVMQLGRLYTMTSLSPKKRISFLKQAKQLNPGSPTPYKYLAIVHLDAFYQFESAIKEIREYVRRRPEDPFGHKYLGYLYLLVKRYQEATHELQIAIQLEPESSYAYAKLSRVYAGLYMQSSESDPARAGYRKKALSMLARSQAVESPDLRRVKWLVEYLTRLKMVGG